MAGVVFTPRAGVHSEFRKEKKKMTDTKKNKKISSSTLSRRESECGSKVFSSRYFVNGDTHMRGERGSNDPEAFSTHCTDNGTKDKPGKKKHPVQEKKRSKTETRRKTRRNQVQTNAIQEQDLQEEKKNPSLQSFHFSPSVLMKQDVKPLWANLPLFLLILTMQGFKYFVSV